MIREKSVHGGVEKKYTNYIEQNHIQFDKTLPIDPDGICTVCESDPLKPKYTIHYFRNNRLQIVSMCKHCNTTCS
jgi:hypothetical protein